VSGSTSARPWSRREDGKAANRQAVIDPTGAIVATYDKLHMFDVDLPTGETARESATYEPGERATVVETPLGAFGLTICYDMRFPALHRALALGGAQILTVPAAFTRPPARRTGTSCCGPGPSRPARS
jgi:predicted amidohydrolase